MATPTKVRKALFSDRYKGLHEVVTEMVIGRTIQAWRAHATITCPHHRAIKRVYFMSFPMILAEISSQCPKERPSPSKSEMPLCTKLYNRVGNYKTS